MTVEVWNRKRLPLAWLPGRRRGDARASSSASASWSTASRGSGVLRNAWTLAPFERVIRHFHVGGERRGVYDLGPVDLAVGDLFAREAAVERARRPRPVHRPAADRRRRPASQRPRPLGRHRSSAGRPDRGSVAVRRRPRRTRRAIPLRRIHPRASARLGTAGHEALRAVARPRGADRPRRPDRPTARPGRSRTTDDDVESLYVVAASIARSLAAETGGVRARRGRLSRAPRRASRPSRSRRRRGQVERVLDLLARLSSHAVGAVRAAARARPADRPAGDDASSSSRPATRRRSSRWLRRLEAGGCRVVVVACGHDAVGDAARARSAGFSARPARLDGPWQTASALEVAS